MVSGSVAEKARKQVIGEIGKESEQNDFIKDQEEAFKETVVQQALNDKPNQREHRDRSHNRARVMRQLLDYFNIDPIFDRAETGMR